MRMWAIFGPDGECITIAQDKPRAWCSAGYLRQDDQDKRLLHLFIDEMRATGYTCREVEVKEVDP